MTDTQPYFSRRGQFRAAVWAKYRGRSVVTYRISLSRFSTRSQSFKTLRSFDQKDAFSVFKILTDCYNWIEYQNKLHDPSYE